MPLIDLANPSRFLALAERLLPWLAIATALVFAFGIWQIVLSPDDYQQGATVKIMFIHVPAAWLAMFAWGLMSVAALGALVWRHPLSDVAAKAAAPIGAAFALICLVTGALWGRPMWGTYWVWDGRLTSMLVLFVMYLGVIALRNAIDEPTRAGRAAAILTLVGLVNIPIIKFSVECWGTLHQPSSVVRFSPQMNNLFCQLLGMTPPSASQLVDAIKSPMAPREIAIHSSILSPLLIMTVAFVLLFITLHLATMRNEVLRRRVRTMLMLRADAAGGH